MKDKFQTLILKASYINLYIIVIKFYYKLQVVNYLINFVYYFSYFFQILNTIKFFGYLHT